MLRMRKIVVGMSLAFLVSACGGEAPMPQVPEQVPGAVAPREARSGVIGFDYVVECGPPLGIGNEYTYDDTNPAMKYAGTWKAETPGRGLYLGTQHITNIGGSTVSFTMPTFPYTLAFGFTMMRNAGKAGVYYNGEFVTTLDMYAPTTTENCVLWLYGGVPAGTLMIKALNQKRPESSGTYINIDYIYYET
jgi:hypothetical protein